MKNFRRLFLETQFFEICPSSNKLAICSKCSGYLAFQLKISVFGVESGRGKSIKCIFKIYKIH